MLRVARAHVVYDRDRSSVINSLSNVAIAVGIEKSLKVPEKHFLSESQRPPLDCVPNTGPQPSLETSVLSSHEG